jgi:hypothetical protein
MVPIISLLIALALSLLITRIAAVALAFTGLSRQSARFQARSAFTGVGFTTSESERAVNHPVRRKILMFLMLIGNAGIVTVVATTILAFLNDRNSENWLLHIALLAAGVSLLVAAATSRWLDRRIERLVRWLLRRYSDLEVRDYAGLMHLGGEYQISELAVEPESWLAGRTLAELGLRKEGVVVLGIQSAAGEYRGVPDGATRIEAGDTLLAYGRDSSFERLSERKRNAAGNADHVESIVKQQEVVAAEKQDADPADRGAAEQSSEPRP